MIYFINNDTFYAKSCEGVNIAQEKNPMTQKNFESKEEMLSWFKTDLSTSFGVDIFEKLELNIYDNEDLAIEYGLENQEISIKLTGDTRLNGKFKINILDENLNKVKEEYFKFTDGVAQEDITFNKAGKYILSFDSIVETDNRKTLFLNHKDELIITVK